MMKRKTVLFATVATLLAGRLQAVDIINQNFDSFTAGVYSNLGFYGAGIVGATTNTASTAQTVVSIMTNGLLSSSASDKVLKLGGTGTPAYSILYGLSSANGVTQGVFSMNFAATTAFNCNIGGSGSSAQIQMGTTSANAIWCKEVATGSTLIYFDQKWAKNAEQSLSITYDVSTHTFSGTINGTNLTVGARTTFGFAKETLTQIGDVNLTYSSANTTLYVDDLKLDTIPETSSPMVLIVVSGEGILLLSKNKSG